jgi:hypothetical protein
MIDYDHRKEIVRAYLFMNHLIPCIVGVSGALSDRCLGDVDLMECQIGCNGLSEVVCLPRLGEGLVGELSVLLMPSN